MQPEPSIEPSHGPSTEESLRQAIAVIKAERGVSETRAYAILVRAAVASNTDVRDTAAGIVARSAGTD
jgi:AmiR/NasT family two-component response regulator